MESFIYYLLPAQEVTSVIDFFEQFSISVYDWILVFAVAFLMLELLNDAFTKRFTTGRFLETLSSLITQIPFYFSEVIVFSLAVYGYFTLYEFIPWKMPVTFEMFFVVLFLADFTYYVEHFLLHKVRLLWLAHSVHHSSSMMNTATAFRFSLFDPVVSAVFHLPLLLLGFHPIFIFAAEILVQAYQFWIHNEIIGKLGVLEKVLNTPSHHRVHHGSDKQYLDKNFGGILIIFDRIFGTFQKEEKIPTYGLTTPMTSKNPFTVQFYEFGKLFSALRQAKTVRQKINHLFKTPDWRPEAD